MIPCVYVYFTDYETQLFRWVLGSRMETEL